jgi:hypothetical protein
MTHPLHLHDCLQYSLVKSKSIVFFSSFISDKLSSTFLFRDFFQNLTFRDFYTMLLILSDNHI